MCAGKNQRSEPCRYVAESQLLLGLIITMSSDFSGCYDVCDICQLFSI